MKKRKIKKSFEKKNYSSSAMNASIPKAAHSGQAQPSGMSAGVAPAGMS